MNGKMQRVRMVLENVLPGLVLAFLLTYTYARFFEHPYQGFRSDSDGKVIYIFANHGSNPTLKLGDRLIQLGDITWSEYRDDLQRRVFEGVQTGDIVPIVVERDGQFMTIPWRFPGPNRDEIVDLIVSESWMVYIFWVAGSLALFNLRPKDQRWALLIAFNYLTAGWLAAGGLSFYHIWESAFVLRSGVWLCVPVYLHLHWVFPKPFGKLPSILTGGVYLFFGGLAVAEWFEVVPANLFYLGFLIATAGSLILLVLHAVLQPEARPSLRLLLIAAFLALTPAILMGFYGTFVTIPGIVAGAAGIIGLPILPLVYFYSVYRRQLGGLELRVNRAISIYIFVILLVLALLPLGIMTGVDIPLPAKLILAVISTALGTIWGFPFIHSFVEHRVLRIPSPPMDLQEIYSRHITASTSPVAIERLLKDAVLPSLLVREFAFMRVDGGSSTTLFTAGVTVEQLPDENELSELIPLAGKYRPPNLLSDAAPCPWVRLVLLLQIREEVIGLWLFGRRDPDDMYSQAEISFLQLLANQTAVALSNILQAEQLRAVYHADINRHEEERQRLALELHDSVLNEMAAMLMGVDLASLPPNFQKANQEVIERLREIVSDLRPPLLDYGLKAGVEELGENLMQRSKDTVRVEVTLDGDDPRYAPEIEQHLFRIVQEACENAVRHGRARRIVVSGRLLPERIELSVEDEGIGFEMAKGLHLDGLLTRKHFGLAGIMQRAALIGGEARIDSAPGAGTRVQVVWNKARA